MLISCVTTAQFRRDTCSIFADSLRICNEIFRVGVKLAIYTLGHPDINILPSAFAHGAVWKISFWVVFIGICAAGWVLSENKAQLETETP